MSIEGGVKTGDVVSKAYADEHPWDEVRETPEGRKIGGRIVVPTEEEAARVKAHMRGETIHMCGFCRHFDLKLGQVEYRQNQRAFEMAFNELEHRPEWYGSVDHMGACLHWDGHSPHAFAPAKIPNQFLDSSVPYHKQDQPVDCPAFEPRSRWHGRNKFSRSHRKG